MPIMPLHDTTLINYSSSTPRAQIIHFSSGFFSLLLTLSLMPSNIQSVMTSPTWHKAIPQHDSCCQILSYLGIAPGPRSPVIIHPSPSDQADNTQYRERRESRDPKFVANWLTAILGSGRTAIIHFISSSQHLDWSGKITSRCLISPGLFYSEIITVICRRCKLVRILLLTLPFITVLISYWFFWPDHSSWPSSYSHILVTMGLLWLWPG